MIQAISFTALGFGQQLDNAQGSLRTLHRRSHVLSHPRK
jgi:hypothetical protein